MAVEVMPRGFGDSTLEEQVWKGLSADLPYTLVVAPSDASGCAAIPVFILLSSF